MTLNDCFTEFCIKSRLTQGQAATAVGSVLWQKSIHLSHITYACIWSTCLIKSELFLPISLCSTHKTIFSIL